MNAVYRAFLNHKQSAVISPLVVLAYEHAESFRKRLADFGMEVGLLTRMTSSAEAKKIMDRLKNGTIDCVVGTHRLL